MKITLEMKTTKLGAALREKRGKKGLREVAEESGISLATFSRIENGSAVDIDTFQLAMRWLGIKPEGWPKYIDWEKR